MPRTDVVVVGAGAAGLAVAGAMKRRDIDPVVLDRDERVGGTWSRRYDRLHLHTVRSYSGLPHRPIRRSEPRYVSKDAFAEYLADYARTFEVDVRLGQPVRAVQPANGLWELETETDTWAARVVVIATGHYNRALRPRWPGVESFGGRLLHSVDYRSGAEFAEQRVLVVGIGNSGAEIAADLVEQGATHVAVSVRTPPPIVPRDLLGLIPIQLFGLAFSRIPAPGLLDRIGAAMRRVAVGDLRKYGLAPAKWGPFTARRPPVIDVGFLELLKARRIEVRPETTRLTPTTAIFADGREERFDAIIAAVGFDTGLADLLTVPDAIDGRGMPAGPSGKPTAYPGLYFTGFEESIGGHLHAAGKESGPLAAEIERYLGTVTA
jgi:cation diffusion facilitator CzcD-associated flavoprotein CzcO